jgi:hypothetical protein
MTGESPTRRATIRTEYDSADVADRVAASLAPDNTDEMAVRVDGDTIAATIERPTTGGLHSTVDDYVVNLHVAVQCTNQTDNTDT